MSAADANPERTRGIGAAPVAADGSPGGSTADGRQRSELRLVSGSLSDEELAAVTVAISALNAASRVEAEERRLADGARAGSDGWSDAVHRLPGMHAARNQCGEAAWAFSHR